VGTPPQDLKFRDEPARLEIGEDTTVREHVSVHPGTTAGGLVTRVGNGCLLMVSAHVGHDSALGSNIVVAAGAAIGGHVMIEDFAIIGGLVGVHQFARIGESALCAAGAMVSADVPPFCTVAGDRARLHGLNTIGLRRRGFTPDTIRTLKRAYRMLFQREGRRDEAVARTRAAFGGVGEVERLVRFSPSRAGVCRVRRVERIRLIAGRPSVVFADPRAAGSRSSRLRTGARPRRSSSTTWMRSRGCSRDSCRASSMRCMRIA
jgi:UDP-N-acetylglucosamine acyltransferase